MHTATDYSHLGTNRRIACSYQDLAKSVQAGKKILFADGSISSVVRKVENGIVTVEILNDGKLGNKKNMCLPGVAITLPTIGTYD
jgi:pyruvate kinase